MKFAVASDSREGSAELVGGIGDELFQPLVGAGFGIERAFDVGKACD